MGELAFSKKNIFHNVRKKSAVVSLNKRQDGQVLSQQKVKIT